MKALYSVRTPLGFGLTWGLCIWRIGQVNHWPACLPHAYKVQRVNHYRDLCIIWYQRPIAGLNITCQWLGNVFLLEVLHLTAIYLESKFKTFWLVLAFIMMVIVLWDKSVTETHEQFWMESMDFFFCWFWGKRFKCSKMCLTELRVRLRVASIGAIWKTIVVSMLFQGTHTIGL